MRASAQRSAISNGRCGSSSPSSIRIWWTDASRVVIGDRALLGDDRDRRHLGEEVVGELVDLRLRGLAAREHAEVDADVSVVVEEGDLGDILHRKR